MFAELKSIKNNPGKQSAIFFSSHEIAALCQNAAEQTLFIVILHCGGRTNWVTSGQGVQRINLPGMRTGTRPDTSAEGPLLLCHPSLSPAAWADPGPGHQWKGLQTILVQVRVSWKSLQKPEIHNMYNFPLQVKGREWNSCLNAQAGRMQPR